MFRVFWGLKPCTLLTMHYDDSSLSSLDSFDHNKQPHISLLDPIKHSFVFLAMFVS